MFVSPSVPHHNHCYHVSSGGCLRTRLLSRPRPTPLLRQSLFYCKGCPEVPIVSPSSHRSVSAYPSLSRSYGCGPLPHPCFFIVPPLPSFTPSLYVPGHEVPPETYKLILLTYTKEFVIHRSRFYSDVLTRPVETRMFPSSIFPTPVSVPLVKLPSLRIFESSLFPSRPDVRCLRR